MVKSSSSSMISGLLSGLILLLIFTVNVIRFIGLEISPPGFHVDELSGAVTVQCLSEEGIDAYDQRYPLFGDLKYGSPKPPTYLYLGILWTKLFGYSITSFRAFSGFFTLLTFAGLFAVSRLLIKGPYALWVLLAASISPWAFQISRIALEAVMAPCFTIWGIYFFLRSHKNSDAIWSGLFFALAIYTYPPDRLYLPLLIIPLSYLKKKCQGLAIRFLLICVLTLVIVCVPLILGMIQGQYMERFNEIGIFADEYWATLKKSRTGIELLKVFILNYLVHFNLDFLFLHGDKNYMYSSQFVGQLSWLDTFAIILGSGYLSFYVLGKIIRKSLPPIGDKEKYLIIFLWLGILMAVIPSALTWGDIPHALRTINVWPMLSLLTGYICFKFTESRKLLGLFPIVISLIFTTIFLRHYFSVYPKKSYYFFNGHTKDQALSNKTREDWNLFAGMYRTQNHHLRYYMMNYLDGQTCSSTQQIWKRVYYSN